MRCNFSKLVKPKKAIVKSKTLRPDKIIDKILIGGVIFPTINDVIDSNSCSLSIDKALQNKVLKNANLKF